MIENLNINWNFYGLDKTKIKDTWILLMPNKNVIDNYNANMINKKEKGEIRQLCFKNCKLTNINYYTNNAKSKIFPLVKLFIKCNNCKVFFEFDNSRIYEIINYIKNNQNINNKYCSIECSSKITIQKAIEWQKENPDMALKQKRYSIKKANEWHDKHPEVRKDNLNKSKQTNKEKSYPGLKAMFKWQNEHSDLDFLKEANKKLEFLRKNDPEWCENMAKILHKNIEVDNKYLNEHPEIRFENTQKIRNAKLQNIKQNISLINFQINKSDININNILQLCKNDICGSYIIKAKFKDYKETKKENKVFTLLACKSIKIYNEIYWILRVLSRPEKQDKNHHLWTISKWWYISNLYYDFEFELLTNPKGISEEEALLAEIKYADENDLYVEFIEDSNGNRIPKISKHAYWSL